MKQTEQPAGICPAIKSKIGGQALIEGVMMHGLGEAAMAVRLPDGSVDVETWTETPGRFFKAVTRVPFLRGIFNFISSMVTGYRCLSKSAEKSGLDLEDGEPGKFERWLEKAFGDQLMKVVAGAGMVLGVLAALALFLWLPALAVKGLSSLVSIPGFLMNILEGVIKLALFLIYMLLVSRRKEIRRVFEYHGAEHKSIFCYENGLELTVENVRKQSRFHPRCGTSFLILILIISILVNSLISWQTVWVRTLLKLLLLPVVMGIGYELLKLCGRYDNWLTRMIAWPGLKLQHLTTREPDSEQIEIAIAALKPVIPANREEDRW